MSGMTVIDKLHITTKQKLNQFLAKCEGGALSVSFSCQKYENKICINVQFRYHDLTKFSSKSHLIVSHRSHLHLLDNILESMLLLADYFDYE